MEKRPLLYLAGGFVLGEVLGLQCMMAVWVLMAVSGGVLYYGFQYVRNQGLQKRSGSPELYGLVLLLAYPAISFLIFFALGFFRGTTVRAAWEKEQKLGIDGMRLSYTGAVERLKDRGDRWEIVLRGISVDEEAKHQPDPGYGEILKTEKDIECVKRLLIYVDKTDVQLWAATEDGESESGLDIVGYGVSEKAGKADLRPRLGWLVNVEGKIQAFEGPRNPGQFDFRNYYRALKLSYRMSADRCVLYPSDRTGWKFWICDHLWQLSEAAGQILDEVAEPQDAGIFKAAILGDKTDLDPDVKDLYQRNGIAHLLAISALHLSLISMAVYSGLRRAGLGFGGAGAAGGIFLICFAVMTGMSPSIVRALVMALCGYLAAYLGRTYDLLSALGLSAILILWDSPYQLTQAGVQLSYAAVLGIAAVGPILKKRGLGPAMSVSIGLQLTGLPIILHHYFQIPLYSIFLNLIVVPLMGIVIASGSAGIILGSRSFTAGRFAIGSGHFVLRFYEFLCTIWMRLPGSNMILGRPKPWQIGGYYGLLVLWLIHIYYTGNSADSMGKEKSVGAQDHLRRGSLGGILPVLGLLLIILPQPPHGLNALFLDVGQGDGICLRTRAGTILVDGGSTSEKTLGEDCLEPFLKSQAIRTIDYAVVSHGDQDHISGLRYLLEEGRDIRIRYLILPFAGRGDQIYDELSGLACAQGADVIWMQAGETLTIGKLSLHCLYPAGATRSADGIWHPSSEERNDHSLVIRADYGSFSMLLTGDMSAEGEQDLLSRLTREDLKNIRILKVAHHGSRYSSSAEFLDYIHPRTAIISCGKNNTYGHPSPETLTRLEAAGIPCITTMDHGAIIISTDGREYTITD